MIVMIARCSIAAFASLPLPAASSQNWHRAVSPRAFQRSVADHTPKKKGEGVGEEGEEAALELIARFGPYVWAAAGSG